MATFKSIYLPIKAGITGSIFFESSQTVDHNYSIEVINEGIGFIKVLFCLNGRKVRYSFHRIPKDIKEMVRYINDFVIDPKLTI